MNKTIIAMLSGAACASAWWAWGVFPEIRYIQNGTTISPYILVLIGLAAVCLWFILEATLKNWNNK